MSRHYFIILPLALIFLCSSCSQSSRSLRVQAEKLDRGRREQILVTDTLWEGRNSGYSTIGSWRPHQFGGEYTDASLLLPDLTAESLDRVSWTSVFSAEKPEAEATAQLCEPDRIFESVHAVSVVKVNDNTWLADMGKSITGYAEIHFPQLHKGDSILMEYCDHLDDDGNTVNQGQTDIFVSAGGKDEYFRNKFNYHGFRYIMISNLPQEPQPVSIKAHLIHTGYRHASSFECSDPDLNRIHDMIRYTLRCLSLGGYLVDCPSLERLGYGGDGNASQTDLAYPLLAGIVPDSLAGKVRENLKDVILNRHNGHFACGLVGIPVFTEWAVKNREADLFRSMLLKRDYPGYLHMLENGATTTWEHWNGARSRIHNCYNGIGQWFYQALGGIKNDERDCAYRSLIIDPQVPEGISLANTSQETPYGTVTVNWKITNAGFHMEVTIPPGSRAGVIIPGHAEKYRINGKDIRNEFSVAEIPGGTYIFEWQK